MLPTEQNIRAHEASTLKSVNGHEELQSVPRKDTTNVSHTNAFPLHGTIALFNYLTTPSPHIDQCRAIMRVFLRKSREYRYQLTIQDVLDVMRETYPGYTLEDCREDLDRLVGWTNLTTLHDTSRVTSIADFRTPVLRYQATSEALEIEVFLAEHIRVGASEGGLHQSDLPRLWDALEQLHAWLQEGSSSFTPERRLAITEQWRDAFSTWEQVTNDAAQYLGSMNRSSQQAVSLDTYLAYKSIVVTYIQSFAQLLARYSQQINDRLEVWRTSGLREALLEILMSSPPPTTQTLTDDTHARQAWRDDVQHQLEALEHWFTNGHNIEMFRRAAHDAIEKVVHRAHALAAAMRPQTDYVTQLQDLASELLNIDSLETAQQLFAAAFACTLPFHEPEGMAGSPSAADKPGERQTWQAAPTVTRSLRPIFKGSSERTAETAMRSNQEALASLRAQYAEEQATRRQRIELLFTTPTLDLGTIHTLTPDERALLTELIDGCLSNPSGEYEAPDGSIIRILNANEQVYTALQAVDGTLLLPRYRLQRVVRQELPKRGDPSWSAPHQVLHNRAI